MKTLFEPVQKAYAPARAVVGTAIEVHRAFGPGFLESLHDSEIALCDPEPGWDGALRLPSAARSGATLPPAVSRAGTSQRDVPATARFMESAGISRRKQKSTGMKTGQNRRRFWFEARVDVPVTPAVDGTAAKASASLASGRLNLP
jgi:hypothetical protein